MVNVELNKDEYELIMRLRKAYNRRKEKYNKFSDGLKKEIERQEKNMRKIASLRFDINSDPQQTYYDAVESSYLKRIRKTITEDGKIYEVLLEDVGDGKGLVEKERKEIGKANNINYRFSKMTNESGSSGSYSYSKLVKTEVENGKKYLVTYENKNDGKGLVEVSRKRISNSMKKKSKKKKSKKKNSNTNDSEFSDFNTNTSEAEREFFKLRNNMRKKFKSRRNNNYSNTLEHKINKYQKKVKIEKIDGEAYKVTYENINDTGFKEVNREKI
jgi:hypothetical protein